MRVTVDIAEGLIADFTAWINKQYGEDVSWHIRDNVFSVDLLRQPAHEPHPRGNLFEISGEPVVVGGFKIPGGNT